MTQRKQQWLILLVACLSTGANAQLLNGDPQFPIANKIRWDMKLDEFRNLCESQGMTPRSTDSTAVFQLKCFGVPARGKIQFDPAERLPQMVEIVFEESKELMKDTLRNYFTRITGKPPLVMVKEKSAIIFTIKMEAASWKVGNELVNVMTMMQGGTILGLNMLITKAGTRSKT
jgi:hypothetical protein